MRLDDEVIAMRLWRVRLGFAGFYACTGKSACATYFLKRSSKAWRASLWRGGATGTV